MNLDFEKEFNFCSLEIDLYHNNSIFVELDDLIGYVFDVGIPNFATGWQFERYLFHE